MKTKILSFLAASCLLIAAARFVHVPDAAQADSVPEQYRETIRKALDYLAGKQFKDGHWEGDDGNHPVAMTALAGLALLMEPDRQDGFVGRQRPVPKGDEKHSANVRKAADWLIAQSQANRDGLIFSEHASETSRYMQGHGLATIFLAGICRDETDEARRKKLTEVLTRAVNYIVLAQSTQGGWHDTSKVEGHDFANIQATAIQVQALLAAMNAGIGVPPATFNDGQEYLKKSMEQGPGPADAAAALACRHILLDRPAEVGPADEKCLKDCRTKIPVGRDLKLGRDELAHYWIAQAEHQFGGDGWKAYRTAMFDRLRDTQSKDGSWPAGNGTCVGQVYSAAVWCTILQLDNDSHPSRRQVPNLDVF